MSPCQCCLIIPSIIWKSVFIARLKQDWWDVISFEKESIYLEQSFSLSTYLLRALAEILWGFKGMKQLLLCSCFTHTDTQTRFSKVLRLSVLEENFNNHAWFKIHWLHPPWLQIPAAQHKVHSLILDSHTVKQSSIDATTCLLYSECFSIFTRHFLNTQCSYLCCLAQGFLNFSRLCYSFWLQTPFANPPTIRQNVQRKNQLLNVFLGAFS